ncbi:MAG: glycosyltransferase [Calditrichaceae bacterium]
MITELSLVLGIAYFFTAHYLMSQKSPQKTEPKKLPEISILVAMRNEEKNIAQCLHSLEEQNYPVHLFRVIIIDDRSDDRSVEITAEFVKRNENFRSISIQEDLDGLHGKMNALSQALEQVESDIVLITDADCIVPNSWIRTYASYFNQNTGMAGGLTALVPLEFMTVRDDSMSLFAKIQALDWLFLQSIASGTSNAGKPVTILGNNFGFRMSAYHETGGFKKLGFSITEDFALMKAIEKTENWEIIHTQDAANTIFSSPVKTMKDFYQQRQRWISGGKSARPWGYFLMTLSLIAHISIILVFSFSQWNASAGAGIGFILGIDYLMIKQQTRRLNIKYLNRYFLHFEIFYILYTVIFGVLFFIPKKIVWKDRSY